jgi:hypothetical protein
LSLAPEAIDTERLSLEPLRVEDAETMAELLGDRCLHEFIGGEPLSALEMRVRSESLGFASDAACALVGWLRARGVGTILANIHPDHEASARVAARAALSATEELANGEQVWRARS